MVSFYYHDQNPFVFPFVFKFVNPSEVQITKALICTRKKTLKDSSHSYSKMHHSASGLLATTQISMFTSTYIHTHISVIEVPKRLFNGYLTIIPRVRTGSELRRGHEGERNKCFSKIQLVGQK